MRWPLYLLCFIYGRTPRDAGHNILHLCLLQSPGEFAGAFYENCAPSRPSVLAKNTALCEQLWQVSDQICMDTDTIDARRKTRECFQQIESCLAQMNDDEIEVASRHYDLIKQRSKRVQELSQRPRSQCL